MSNSRSSHITAAAVPRPAGAPAAPETVEPVAPSGGLVQSWVNFWFSPTDPVGLHVVRVLAGLLFLAWLLPFAGDVQEFFGLQSWFDVQAYRDVARDPDGSPVPIGWSVLYLIGTDPVMLTTVYWLSILVLVLFTLGLWTRPTSVLTWVVVASFPANPAIGFGGDAVLNVLAFYLMVGYVLRGLWSTNLTTLEWVLGPKGTFLFRGWLPGSRTDARAERPVSYAANVAMRLLQVHFAIVVLVSGLHKLQYADWWSGVALWYPLHPPFETTAQSIRAEAAAAQSTLFMLSLVGYLILAWQIGFPAFAWRQRWRVVLLGGAALGWLGLAFIYHQPLMGPALIVGCLSYVTATEWLGLGNWLARALGAGAESAARRSAAPRGAVKVGSKS